MTTQVKSRPEHSTHTPIQGRAIQVNPMNVIVGVFKDSKGHVLVTNQDGRYELPLIYGLSNESLHDGNQEVVKHIDTSIGYLLQLERRPNVSSNENAFHSVPYTPLYVDALTINQESTVHIPLPSGKPNRVLGQKVVEPEEYHKRYYRDLSERVRRYHFATGLVTITDHPVLNPEYQCTRWVSREELQRNIRSRKDEAWLSTIVGCAYYV